jgi:hypothetical protein
MTPQPKYFEPIREAAARRWDQLERDPDLAGPWHQLFKQVQSPRHVLSELLQNADDAGATETYVRIDKGQFTFTHNGEDFVEEHLTSLCRFGYSNKRSLHTIGFRGIGFKSTFSLGDTVELHTPTLSVAFHRRRFTEPKWIPCPPSNDGLTQIRVAVGDAHREEAIKENLEEWIKSPVSLLFFKNIRRMKIGDREVHWKCLGSGPVPESERMALDDNPDEEFLLAHSGLEAFPAEALQEIKEERDFDRESEFPPCRVEIVLGAKGQLYVVLPTGVTTSLPFACNAPFIQDSARLKIKELGISPTNRWLLERVGKLAASVMLQWLGQENASVAERSRAYRLFPDVDRADLSLEGKCATIVEEAFANTIAEQPFLLTNGGDLKVAKESVIIPEQLLDVWPGEQITAVVDSGNRPAFSRYVSGGDRQKLIHWGLIEQISKKDVLNILQSKHLPKPESWRRLLKLWAYIASEVTGYLCSVDKASLRVIPAQGKDVLYAASEVVRLGEKRLLQSDGDWEFLAGHLLVLNQNWPRFLSEQRRATEEKSGDGTKEEVEAAFAVLGAIGLNDTSDVSKVVEQVAAEFFKQPSVKLAGCIQIAQIAAKLGATVVGGAFRFATQDRHLRATETVVLYDEDGTLEALFPENWCASHLLHADYWQSFTSCTSDEWSRWLSTGRAGLQRFVPLVLKSTAVWGRHKLEAELRRRGFQGAVLYHYKTSDFRIEDWDFEDSHWRHWTTIAVQDSQIWSRVVERVLSQPEIFWSSAESARAIQVATTGSTRAITNEELPPRWILRLRELPCLPDTRGFYHKPEELLLRTPETEPFMDVEPFIHGRLDREAVRSLLILLGVRETPTGPDRLLDCLRALAMAERPPIHEVEKWYRRLDQMVDTCSTADLANVKKAFREEKIILTEAGGWTTAYGIFLSSDEEDVPGAEVVRTSVQDLALWRKLGIAERPTVELAIQWLKQLPSGASLSQNDGRRVRALLARHAVRIWDECGHWLNLAGEWVPTTSLGYALTMQSLVPWSHLHEWVKQKTADLQRLPVEITQAFPFSDLPHLAGHIEERFHRNPLLTERPARRPWLNQLGTELKRIELDGEAETAYIRARAAELAITVWQTTPGLEIIPYIGGVPAGTPRSAEAIWLDNVLYVEDRPVAKLARAVSQELGRAFRRQDIADAIKFCFDRPPEFVTEYLEENFILIPRGEVQLSDDEPAVLSAVGDEPDAKMPETSPSTNVLADDQIIATADEVSVQPTNGDSDTVPEDSTEDEVETVDGVVTPERDRHPARPGKPSIMERFARTHGFRKDGEDRFFHPDGSWISKPGGTRFWERRAANGELVRYYWPKDHCLEHEPLQIEADIWGWLEKSPDTYALVLSDEHDDAVEITGKCLCAMRDGGEIKLYPAAYRLVYDDDRKSAELRTPAEHSL